MQDPTATQTLTGSCFCGQSRFIIDLGIMKSSGKDDYKKVPSNLNMTAYCHCTNCQRLSGSPFVWSTHWKREAVRWQGVESNAKLVTRIDGIKVEVPDTLDVFESIPGKSWRLRCNRCGSPMGAFGSTKDWGILGTSLQRSSQSDQDDPKTPINSNQPSIIGWNLIKPTAHIFYGSRVLDVRDELCKWEQFIEE